MLAGKRMKRVVLFLCFALFGNSIAGKLGDFEESVAKPAPPSRSGEKLHYSDEYDDSEFFGEVVIGVIAGLGYGVYRGIRWVVYDWWAEADAEPALVVDSTNDVDYAAYEYTDDELDGFNHKIGTPGTPYLRFDYRWQYLDSDVDANDYLLEAGYKYLALYGRVTQYEGAADEHLDIEQYYGMVRFGGTDEFYFSGSFQIGGGIGWYSIEGDETQEGPALTIPMILYPSEWCGFEFRPAWAYINDKTVGDYDVSFSLGQQFTHLRLGYRWFWVQHEGHWLDGPYAGISLSF